MKYERAEITLDTDSVVTIKVTILNPLAPTHQAEVIHLQLDEWEAMRTDIDLLVASVDVK